MAPRGRPRTGLKRIDAAIDAMLPFGFTIKQVRKCVKQLLKEYGGDDGWPFIEDGSYNELIAALLRDVEKESQEELALDGNQIVQDQKPLKEKTGGEEELAGPSNIAPDTEEEPQDDAQIEEKSGGDEELVGPSNIAPDTEEEPQEEPICPDNRIHTTTPLINNGSIFNPPDILQQNALCLLMSNCETSDRNGGKDIHDKSENDQESPIKEDSPSISTEVPPLLPRKEHSRRCRHFYGWIDRSGEGEDDDDDFIILPPSSMMLGPAPLRKCSNGEARKRRSRWDVSPGDP